MPMTRREIACAPQHPQLMDPAGPEELIEASIWWYPSLFPHRTAVLQHLLHCPGNGYEWDEDGQIRSVFAHLQPDYSALAERLTRGGHEPAGQPAVLEEWQRRDLDAASLVRATARDRAHVYGPVTVSSGRRTSNGWDLMSTRPQRVHPRWQGLLDEAGHLFARAWALQDAAEARLRRQWARNPAARAAQLLTRQLGHAWASDDITDSELSACDQLLASWRLPAWPSRIDRHRLRQQRDCNRAQRELARQILADLAAEGQPASAPAPAHETPRTGANGPQHRQPRDVLLTLAADRLSAVSCLVRPVPFTAWHEWEWTLNMVRQELPPSSGADSRSRTEFRR